MKRASIEPVESLELHWLIKALRCSMFFALPLCLLPQSDCFFFKVLCLQGEHGSRQNGLRGSGPAILPVPGTWAQEWTRAAELQVFFGQHVFTTNMESQRKSFFD